MLVLSRKVGERIQIGDNVTVVVNRISGNRITLAIEAPREIKIVRGEIASSPDTASPPVEAVPASSGEILGNSRRKFVGKFRNFY